VKKEKTGFTLVEMLAVITIAAIMLGAGVYYLSALNPRKVEAEAIKLISELKRVRQAALSRHQNYSVTFDTAGDSYRLSSESGDERQNNNLAADLTSVTDFSGSPVNQALFYYPKGISQDRIINLSYGGISRMVRLFSQTGYARMELN
jgi:prepilin-type N-terminal cleavage/methylation domain-containing protein